MSSRNSTTAHILKTRRPVRSLLKEHNLGLLAGAVSPAGGRRGERFRWRSGRSSGSAGPVFHSLSDWVEPGGLIAELKQSGVISGVMTAPRPPSSSSPHASLPGGLITSTNSGEIAAGNYAPTEESCILLAFFSVLELVIESCVRTLCL